MRPRNEITSIALSTDDDIIIVDPEREYAPLVRALGGEVVQIAAGSHNHINAMDMTNGYGEEEDTVNGPLLLKSQFVMSLCEQLMKPSLIDAKERSIIARCVKSVYQNYTQGGAAFSPRTGKSVPVRSCCRSSRSRRRSPSRWRLNCL